MSLGKRKRTKKQNSNSKIFDLFVGSHVTMLMRVNSSKTRVAMLGILLDEDEQHYFISEDGKQVHAAILKDAVMCVMFTTEGDLMNQIDIPSDQEVQ